MDGNHFHPAYQPYAQGPPNSSATPQQSQPQQPPSHASNPQSQQQQQQQQQSHHHVHPHQHQQQQQQPHSHPSLTSYGSNLSASGQHQPQPPQQPQQSQRQQPSPSHTTLPPLQAQNGYPQFGSVSYGHPSGQSPASANPHAGGSANITGAPSNNYSQHISPSTAAGPNSMLPPSFSNPYGTMPQPSMMYSTSSATALPPTSATVGLPTIRPMPPGGVNGVNGLPSLASANHLSLGQQPSFLQSEDQPTHVVGSQGRRGILPTAPGRPVPPPQGTPSAVKSMIPQKDKEGKYPCPHCSKTYLHAKHLKRHLLRHTGDRPYMCHLCKDTFSRSDILKRHFQKCSLRRGNPTGANHLAHQRRNTNNGSRLSISQQDGPIGLAGMPEVVGSSAYAASPTVNEEMSGRSSRTNSLIHPGTVSHRNSVAGLGILGSSGQNPTAADQMGQTTAPYQPGMTAYAMQNATNGGAPAMSNYPFNTAPQLNSNIFNNTQNQQQQQQMSFLGHQSSRFGNSQENNPHQLSSGGDGTNSGVDWTRMFTQGGQDGFIGSSQTANASSQGTTQLKSEHDTKHDFNANDFNNESFLGSLYSHPGSFLMDDGDGAGHGPGGSNTGNGAGFFPNWSMEDPLQSKVDDLIHHCFPHGADSTLYTHNPAADVMKSVLNVDTIKSFAEHYTSYHGHWPLLHMPTFKLSEANNNVVLALLSIGAVYSPELTVHQVRQMMEFIKATVHGSCSIYTRFQAGQTEGLGEYPIEVEELQALIMLIILFTWHGDPAQRQAARAEFVTLVRIVKAMNLCEAAPPSHFAHSVLHSAHGAPTSTELANWDWHGWLEQEKRIRALYQVFVMDTALVMYFNTAPQFDPLEVRLMLPADDAAWDAANAEECADALGLNGPHAQCKNLNGTRKTVQLRMRDAMRILLDSQTLFQPSATNVYSKFLLIHALILRIIMCQRATLMPESTFQGFNLTLSASAPATPLSQTEWLEQHGSGHISANTSGHVTPTDSLSPSMQGGGTPQHEKKRLSHALEKWKRNWDADIELQYPPIHIQPHRRFGFSRDGVHFFYLGRSFLQSQHIADFSLPADVRFKRVMGLLKRIKAVIAGDHETKGQDIGSVGDIDDQYGLDSLTLDMKLLFKPYNSQLDEPLTGVKTDE